MEDAGGGLEDIPKILVGLPSRGMWPAAFEKTIAGALAGHNEFFIAQKYYSEWYITDDARNTMACAALRQNFDYVFFMDTDQVFPPKALFNLLCHSLEIESEVPIIVGGVYTSRAGHHRWHLYKGKVGDKWQSVKFPINTGRYEVDVIGTGCMLIDTNVFKLIEFPWFHYKYLNFDEKELTYDRMSEDFVFCEKVKEANIPIYADTDVTCGHLHSVAVWPVNDGEYEVQSLAGEVY